MRRTISPSDLTSRQIALASAGLGMSGHKFILEAIDLALHRLSEADSLLGAALARVGSERVERVKLFDL